MLKESFAAISEEAPVRKSRLASALSRMARFAGILEDAPDDNKPNRNPTAKKHLGKRVVSGALMTTAPLASALGASEALDYRPAKPAHVDIIPGLPTAETPPTYDSSRIFLSIRGFGREIAHEMASEAQPVSSEYGQAACLVMNPKNLNTSEIVEALEKGLLPHIDESSGELELNIHIQSAGAKMTLPSINTFLANNDDVTLNLLLLDGSPYDENDVLGSTASLLVHHPELARGGHIVGTIAQAYSMSNDFSHHSLFKKQTWEDAFTQASAQRTSGLRAQARAIGAPLGDLSAIAADDPRAIYIRPSRPDVDKFVNTSQAFDKWAAVLDSYGVKLTGVAVNSNSHTALIRGGKDTEEYLEAFSTIFDDEFNN